MSKDPPVDTDKEDFSKEGDNDDDGLEVKGLSLNRNTVKFRVKYLRECKNLEIIIHWGDGHSLTDHAITSNGEEVYSHDYEKGGEYKITINVYCDGRQIASDSDVVFLATL